MSEKQKNRKRKGALYSHPNPDPNPNHTSEEVTRSDNGNRDHWKRRNNVKRSNSGHAKNRPTISHHQQNEAASHNKDDVDSNANTHSSVVLWWLSTQPHVPLEREQAMLDVILRWGEKERGMLRDQPEFRLRQIRKACQLNRITISQACSLRRHHMSQLNPYKSKETLRLGNSENIKASAQLFEEAVENFLRQKSIAFFTEKQQRAHFKKNNKGVPMQATPDFMMKNPVSLKVYSVDNRKGNGNNRNRKRIHEERTIHWLEAKMFYGASTIPEAKNSAVGAIPDKMKKYVELYGEGAIVFSQGCGETLAARLAEIGVTALCCPSSEFDLTELYRHQMTWCADRQGNILP